MLPLSMKRCNIEKRIKTARQNGNWLRLQKELSRLTACGKPADVMRIIKRDQRMKDRARKGNKHAIVFCRINRIRF